MQILSGDIGGTNTRLALFQLTQDARPRLLLERRYPSAGYSGLTPILEDFLGQRQDRPGAIALGLAGPILGGRCQLTNLPWLVDAHHLQRHFGIPRVRLLNDLEATAWGIDSLQPQDLLTLQPGSPEQGGNRAVIAAGTGLGQAGLFWDGHSHRPFATEGGHCDFAPADPLTFALLRWLQKRSGRNQVSWELLVSGPGLVRIHRFLHQHQGVEMPQWLQQRMQQGDPAAAISSAAEQEKEPLCRRSMALFARLYAAEAGNLALKMMATGGLYIGGGIAPKILPWLRQEAFLQAFNDKGDMTPLLQRIPLRVILNDKAALYGPARFLQQQLPAP